MQPWLRRLALVEGEVKLSFKRRRRGWLFSSSLSLETLRARMGRHAVRVNLVHPREIFCRTEFSLSDSRAESVAFDNTG